MDKPRPLKRNPQLAPLSREHHDALLYVWKIRRGLANKTSVEKLRNYTLWYWKEHTRPHFFQEEKLLLPFLSEDDPMAARLKNEHAQIRELVLSLDKEAEPAIFELLADLAEKHIRWEERELFEHLQKKLNTDQLNSLQKELEAHPIVCNEWTDPFWA